MREPIIESLSRFTPDGSGLDHDAILFAAGRASARPNLGWMALTGSLAACQLVTLALLWPRPTPVVNSNGTLIADTEIKQALMDDTKQISPAWTDTTEIWTRNRQMLMTSDTELPPPVASAGPMIPSDPPLRAFSTSAFLGLD
ncbi:MAG TPA: hypothetical protein VGX70_18820 [Gemmataceae bacterium]|jgi:hypothetical protein|nr:hypothetical protein [Gemmataceae bacterium]